MAQSTANYKQAAIALARVRMQEGRYDLAAAICDELLVIDPKCLDTLRIAGTARLFLKQFSAAVPLLRRALGERPDDPGLASNLGLALECSGEASAAAEVLRAAAIRHPDRRDILLNLSVALQRLYAWDEATAICHSLLSRDAADVHALCNLGGIHREAGRLDLAVSCFKRALAINPQLREVREQLAFVLLLSGDFAQGWAAYESRNLTDRSGLSARVPRWNGDLGSASALTIVAEQGFGDALQFVRYGALLKEAGLNPTLQCHSRMVNILRSCGYFRDVVPFGARENSGQTGWVPLLSLPLVFGTNLETIPARVPYLHADPGLMARWRAKLEGDPSFKIGIAWQGNPNVEVMGLRDRSVPLADFAPLAAIPGVRLYSLQRLQGVEQIRGVGFSERIYCPNPELDNGEHEFMDTAALMSQLDLIITPDTSIAHLAGALGIPVWTALKYSPDWRWLLGRNDCPWYPTMRLFRQRTPQQWAPVFEELARSLQLVAGARTSS